MQFIRLRYKIEHETAEQFLVAGREKYDIIFIDPPYDIPAEKIDCIIRAVRQNMTDIESSIVVLEYKKVFKTNFAKNMNKVWKLAFTLFSERCSMCHALPKTTTFTANQWPATLKVMTRRAAFSKKQADIVSKFLQYHAKDTIKFKK